MRRVNTRVSRPPSVDLGPLDRKGAGRGLDDGAGGSARDRVGSRVRTVTLASGVAALACYADRSRLGVSFRTDATGVVYLRDDPGVTLGAGNPISLDSDALKVDGPRACEAWYAIVAAGPVTVTVSETQSRF